MNDKIKTGCQELNDIIGGGISKTDVGVISGEVNSKMLTSIVAGSVINNSCKVLHLIYDEEITKGYLAYISGIDTSLLQKNESQFKYYINNDERGKREFEALKNKETVLIKKQISNIKDFERILLANEILKETRENYDGNFDLVAFDNVNNIPISQIKEVAEKYNIAIWTTFYGENKENYKGDVVLNISSTPEGRKENLIDITCNGYKFYDAFFDEGTCHFDFYLSRKEREDFCYKITGWLEDDGDGYIDPNIDYTSGIKKEKITDFIIDSKLSGSGKIIDYYDLEESEIKKIPLKNGEELYRLNLFMNYGSYDCHYIMNKMPSEEEIMEIKKAFFNTIANFKIESFGDNWTKNFSIKDNNGKVIKKIIEYEGFEHEERFWLKLDKISYDTDEPKTIEEYFEYRYDTKIENMAKHDERQKIIDEFDKSFSKEQSDLPF